MMYPFLTLSDETEITHSEKLPSGEVKVYVEKPDSKDCFHYASCYLPNYRWEDCFGFTSYEIEEYEAILRSVAHLIMRYSEQGGFENASGF